MTGNESTVVEINLTENLVEYAEPVVAETGEESVNGEIPDQDSAPEFEAIRAKLSRRNLLRNGGAFAMTAVAGSIVTGTAVANTSLANTGEEPPPAMRSPRHPVFAANSGTPDLPPLPIIAMNRMAFGIRPEDWGAFQQLGETDDARFEAYVEQQLDPASIDDSECDAILAAQGFTTLTKNLDRLWAEHVAGEADRYQPFYEVEAATFLRALYSKRQLREVLADHWHNHFNVYGRDYWSAPVWAHYDRAIIRNNMLGNFRQMLEAVTKSPAMLYYLDNQSNSGDRPNENFAREGFELHTMGAENYLGVRDPNDPTLNDENGQRIGYIDDDIYGATTCFTGWRVNTDTGLFEFDEGRHFPFHKFVLGKLIPANQGIQDGYDVLDLLAYHPGTARHVCRRLCRRLISDNPPESVVEAAAAVFRANKHAPDQLKKVVRAILLSTEFRTTWGEKIKRPFEYAMSLLRAANADFVIENSFLYTYNQIGQPLFQRHPPDGYPDDRVAWSSTMPLLQRWRLCNWVLDWDYGGDGPNQDAPRLRFKGQMPANKKTPKEIVDFWIWHILRRPIPTEERQPLVDFMAYGRNPDFELPPEQIDVRLRYMIGLIFMSPSFQWR